MPLSSEDINILFVVYIFVKDILPLIIPDAVKVWSKGKSREDRLFAIIEQNNERDKELAVALTKLTDAMEGIDKRIAAIENKCKS